MAGGVTATGFGGTGPGTITLGQYSSITFDDTQTFDNATLALSGYDTSLDQYTSYAAYVAAGYTSTSQTLTLGPNLTVNATGSYSNINSQGGYGSGAIVNDGTINAEASSGQLNVNSSDFTNAGFIDVTGGDDFSIQGGTFANAAGGTIDVGTGSSLVLGNGASGEVLSNAGTIAASGATVTLYGALLADNTGSLAIAQSTVRVYGSLTTAQLAPFDNQGDTLQIYGTLDNTGSVLTVGAGTALGQMVLESGGTITGGTIADAGVGLSVMGGTLAGVTYEGTVDLTPQSSSLDVVDGLTATGVGGVGAGTIDVGSDSNITFIDTQTLDDAAVVLSGDNASVNDYISYAAYVAAGYKAPSETLTLGANLTVDATGNYASVGSSGGYGAASIVNDGTIDVETTSNRLTLNAGSFINAGSIEVAGTSALSVQTASFTNSAGGVITGAQGSSLVLGNGSSTQSFSNLGTIAATGATVTFYWNGPSSQTGTLSIAQSTVDLYGDFTTAMLAPFAGQGDTIQIYGTLDNTGSTLAVGAGTALGTLALENGGTIVGGTIQDAGSGVNFAGGTLDGVTYQGALNPAAQSAALYVAGGLTLTGAGGAGPGILDLGQYSTINFADTQTLDDATVTMSGSGTNLDEYTTYAAYSAAGYKLAGQVLTLGANLIVDASGSYSTIGNAGYGSSTIVNDGTINAGIQQRANEHQPRQLHEQRRHLRHRWRHVQRPGGQLRQRGRRHDYRRDRVVVDVRYGGHRPAQQPGNDRGLRRDGRILRRSGGRGDGNAIGHAVDGEAIRVCHDGDARAVCRAGRHDRDLRHAGQHRGYAGHRCKQPAGHADAGERRHHHRRHGPGCGIRAAHPRRHPRWRHL